MNNWDQNYLLLCFYVTSVSLYTAVASVSSRIFSSVSCHASTRPNYIYAFEVIIYVVMYEAAVVARIKDETLPG